MKKKEQGKLSPKQGLLLLKLARATIAKKLGIDDLPNALIDPTFLNQKLQSKSGTFVTLHLNNNLRGCIGNLAASDSIADGIKKNAINAAFNDPRFSPLSKNEFNKIHIEVSVLSQAKVLEYKDANDLIAKLRPKIDGVIIKKNFKSATFLPQVWDQLPKTENFLSNLCHKAGLNPDEWRDGSVEVLTYQVQYFEE